MDYSKKRKCQRLWKILNLSQNERCKLEYKHIKAWKYRLDVSKLTMINIFQLQNVQRVPQYSKNCITPNTERLQETNHGSCGFPRSLCWRGAQLADLHLSSHVFYRYYSQGHPLNICIVMQSLGTEVSE